MRFPLFWMGHIIGGTPKPWEYFKVENILVNSYDIINKKSAYQKIIEIGIKKFLGFDGPVMLDSGGFFFLKKNIEIPIEEIMDLYEKANADLCVALDVPFHYTMSDLEKEKRIDTTLRNFEIMINSVNMKKVKLVPVIHGHNKKQIDKVINFYQKFDNFDIYGLGSLVPLMFPYTLKKWRIVIEIINYVKNRIGDSKLHIFGLGNAVTILLVLYLGVDSVDSVAWRKKAAFGTIQMPGIGQRFIKKGKSKSWTKQIDWKTFKCDCIICKGLSSSDALENLYSSFQKRALHNAWVFQKEVELFKEHSQNEKELEKWLDVHLKESALFKIYQYIKTLKVKKRAYLQF